MHQQQQPRESGDAEVGHNLATLRAGGTVEFRASTASWLVAPIVLPPTVALGVFMGLQNVDSIGPWEVAIIVVTLLVVLVPIVIALRQLQRPRRLLLTAEGLRAQRRIAGNWRNEFAHRWCEMPRFGARREWGAGHGAVNRIIIDTGSTDAPPRIAFGADTPKVIGTLHAAWHTFRRR